MVNKYFENLKTAFINNSVSKEFPNCCHEWNYYMSGMGSENCVCGKKDIHELHYIKNSLTDAILILGSDCINNYLPHNLPLVDITKSVTKKKNKKKILLDKMSNGEKIAFLVGDKAYKCSYSDHIYSIPLRGKRSLETFTHIKSMYRDLNICFYLDKKGFPYIKVYYRNDANKYLEVNKNKIMVKFSIINGKYLNACL